MRTDADDLARVRNPAIERLLNHTATLADKWCSHIEIGARAGGVAFWLAERVAPDGKVIATDLETDSLEVEAAAYPTLEVLRHDITAEDLPTGFDFMHARWMVNWLPDERQAQRRMMAALR